MPMRVCTPLTPACSSSGQQLSSRPCSRTGAGEPAPLVVRIDDAAGERELGEGRGHEGRLREGGRDDPAQVTGDTASDADDGVASLGLQLRQPDVDGLGQLKALASLAGGDYEAMGGYAPFLERPLDVPAVEVHHVGIGDDVGSVNQPQILETIAQGIDQPPTGHHGIGPSRVVYFRRQVCVRHRLVSVNY